MEKRCSFTSLRSLFQKYSVVSVGDELGAFYLNKWATLTEDSVDNVDDISNSPLYPWNKRSLFEAKVSYMEFVYAAYEEGVRDIVIDMSSSAQTGIDEGLEIYAKASLQQTTETLFSSLLISDLSTPMDAVVQMAGSLGMKVHALNCGLTGIATLFRETVGISEIPSSLNFMEKFEYYMANGFEKDKLMLRYILRRLPTQFEIDIMQKFMERRLTDRKHAIEKMVFDESITIQAINEAVGNRQILGFFQNARLFNSAADLDDGLRSVYGNNNVARLSMLPFTDMQYPKYSQYHFQYSVKECRVAMTKDYVQAQQGEHYRISAMV